MTEVFMPDVLTWIIPYLQLREFLEQHKDTLGPTVQSALETVDANLLWLEKYGGDISAWLAATEASPSPSAASYLSFSPTMSIVIILSGYLITKYWHYLPSEWLQTSSLIWASVYNEGEGFRHEYSVQVREFVLINMYTDNIIWLQLNCL